MGFDRKEKMVKGTYVDKNGVRKGAWTKQEDDKLRSYVERCGHWNWRLLPKFAGLDRCGKGCRLRWTNHLKPGLNRGDYTQQERDLIAKLHLQHGNKWSAIAAELPGRTDHGIKNYWNTRHKNRENTTSKSSASEEAEISELSNVDTSVMPAPKLRSHEHIKSRVASSQAFVLESSDPNSTAVPTVVELGSDSSVEQSCSNMSSITSIAKQDVDHFSNLVDSGFHESFWTQPFVVETDSYHGHGFRVCDGGGVSSSLFDTWLDDANDMQLFCGL